MYVQRKLDPIVGTRPPETAATEAAVRLADVQIVWDTCVATRDLGRGARRSVARKHGVAPSTVTEAIKRFELAMGARLFRSPRSDDEIALTCAGSSFISHGRVFIESFHILRKLLQDAIDHVVQ